MNRTNKNPNFFDVDKIFDDFITNHNKTFELYLVRVDFKLNFDKFTPHFKTGFHYKISLINMKELLLYWIDSFVLRGINFQILMKWLIKHFLIKRNMSYNYYIKNPLHMVEIRLNMIISGKPCLISASDRGVSHLLYRKFSLIPFNN